MKNLIITRQWLDSHPYAVRQIFNTAKECKWAIRLSGKHWVK